MARQIIVELLPCREMRNFHVNQPLEGRFRPSSTTVGEALEAIHYVRHAHADGVVFVEIYRNDLSPDSNWREIEPTVIDVIKRQLGWEKSRVSVKHVDVSSRAFDDIVWRPRTEGQPPAHRRFRLGFKRG